MRRAFSLLEVLVVIAIFAIILGLILPAVQRAREAAARARCAVQMRQLGLALHSYHDAFGRFPPGRAASGQPMAQAGWPVFILAFIEQQGLSRDVSSAFRSNPNPFFDPPHGAAGLFMPVFVCPSDGRIQGPVGLWRFNPATLRLEQRNTAFLSYMGVTGTDRTHCDGTFFQGARTRIADIPDGTSNTLMLGERPPSANLLLGWWYAGIGDDRTGTGDFFIGVREFPTTSGLDEGCHEAVYHFARGKFDGPCDHLHYWSPHPGGANFLFCDGSVRFLSYSADGIMPALATRAGGEQVTVPD